MRLRRTEPLSDPNDQTDGSNQAKATGRSEAVLPGECPQTCRCASGHPRGDEETWSGLALPHEQFRAPQGGSSSGLSLRGRALRLLAAREHSRLELRRKLGRHAESGDQIDKLLDELERQGLLNTQRLVESVLHQRAAGHGSLRLRQTLLAKGLTPQEFQSALAAIAGSELERALALYQRRFGESGCCEARELARRQRYLLSRGFPGEVVKQVLKFAATGIRDEQLDDRDSAW